MWPQYKPNAWVSWPHARSLVVYKRDVRFAGTTPDTTPGAGGAGGKSSDEDSGDDTSSDDSSSSSSDERRPGRGKGRGLQQVGPTVTYGAWRIAEMHHSVPNAFAIPPPEDEEEE